MRIACVYLPSFPLQAAFAAGRPPAPSACGVEPPQLGDAIAVVSQPVVGSPVVLACSRAAWATGVRPTMTAAAARALVPDLRCIIADVAAERSLLRALGEALLSVAPSVDLGGDPRGPHHVLYAEVPAGRRGSWFGTRISRVLELFGLRGRVGIADDRFTAYVAASTAHSSEDGEGVVCVPRGGSAVFLAPQPLSLLQLAPEVQHMLEALGVRTLGAFATLPPPSVARGARTWDADFQALARGDGGASLDAYLPTGPVVETATVAGVGLGPAVEGMARRLAARLSGRGWAPARLELRVQRADGDTVNLIDIREPARAAVADDLADLIGGRVGDGPVTALELVARGDGIEVEPVVASGERAPVAQVHLAEPVVPPLVLVAPTGLLGERAEHRRTRRGKQRPRIAVGQARLFAGD